MVNMWQFIDHNSRNELNLNDKNISYSILIKNRKIILFTPGNASRKVLITRVRFLKISLLS